VSRSKRLRNGAANAAPTLSGRTCSDLRDLWLIGHLNDSSAIFRLRLEILITWHLRFPTRLAYVLPRSIVRLLRVRLAAHAVEFH
jgi:hypothetical protein